MIKTTSAALLCTALTVSAANVAFNTPLQWGTIRTGTINASYIVDSSLVGKQLQLTLTENSNGAEHTLSTQTVAVKDLNGEVTIPLAGKKAGGESYLSLKWRAGDQFGAVMPFGSAPVESKIDPTALKAPSITGEPTNASLVSAGSIVTKAGTCDVQFGWSPNAFVVAAKGAGVVTVTLDPDNSKSAFRAFSDRSITIDFTKNSVVYSYLSRIAKENRVIYRTESWLGDMKGSAKNGEALVVIPWYDLGAKPFAGRQMGITIQQGATLYPAQANPLNPSTWGNILLK